MGITRRGFLKAGAVSAVGMISAWQIQAHGQARIRLSACDWSMQETTRPEGLEVAKSLGLDGLEVSAADEPRDTLKIADPAFREEYKAVMARSDTVVSSIAMGLLNGNPFASDERAPAWLEQTIAAAADLDAKVILLAFFGQGDLIDRRSARAGGSGMKDDAVAVVVARLKAAAPKAADAGVILGLENTLSAEQNMQILDRVGHDAVQVYYDVGNSTYNGYDVPAEIRALDKRICQIHFKDGRFALGEGKVDMDAVAQAMNDIQYDGWVTLETAILEDDRDASFRRNAEFTRNLFSAV